jgi:ubiquinone/menaquinone biosynthesis C-methylase UbiE
MRQEGEVARSRQMTIYNQIGHHYAKTRLADDRITSRLISLLNLPPHATVLDVGAGTGKYARALADRGFSVIALEPSDVMQAQATPHAGVRFIQASAESIPLPDHSVDGAIVVLAVHHFDNRAAAYREIARVVGKGPMVLLTFDPSGFRRFWLADYFMQLGARFRCPESELRHTAAEIERVTSRRSRIIAFPLPPDLQDKFGASCWSQPEAYLDEGVRRGISDFALMSPSELDQGLRRLEADLQSGDWNAKYGALRTQESYDVGYQFIVAEGTLPLLR